MGGPLGAAVEFLTQGQSSEFGVDGRRSETSGRRSASDGQVAASSMIIASQTFNKGGGDSWG